MQVNISQGTPHAYVDGLRLRSPYCSLQVRATSFVLYRTRSAVRSARKRRNPPQIGASDHVCVRLIDYCTKYCTCAHVDSLSLSHIALCSTPAHPRGSPKRQATLHSTEHSLLRLVCQRVASWPQRPTCTSLCAHLLRPSSPAHLLARSSAAPRLTHSEDPSRPHPDGLAIVHLSAYPWLVSWTSCSDLQVVVTPVVATPVCRQGANARLHDTRASSRRALRARRGRETLAYVVDRRLHAVELERKISTGTGR